MAKTQISQLFPAYLQHSTDQQRRLLRQPRVQGALVRTAAQQQLTGQGAPQVRCKAAWVAELHGLEADAQASLRSSRTRRLVREPAGRGGCRVAGQHQMVELSLKAC